MNLLWQKWRGYLAIGMVVAMLAFCVTGCGTKDEVDYAAMEGQEAAMDYSKVSVLRLMTEQSFIMMTEQYIVASMATEQAARLGKDDKAPVEFQVALHRAAEAWDTFETMKQRTLYLADAVAKLEEAKPKKTAMLFDSVPFFSRALAANASAGAFQEQMQRGYETSGIGTIRDLAGRMGTVDGETARDLVRQAERDRLNWDNTANVNKEHVAALAKVAKIGAGIALIPVGIGVGLVGASAGGVVTGVIGVTATMSGALSTAISVGEELSGRQMTGTNKAVKNMVDFVAVTSGGANLMCSLTGSAKGVLDSFANSGKNFTAKEFAAKWAKDFFEGNGTLGNILMVNDAKSANDFIKDLKAQGMDCVAGVTQDGKPCIILKKVEKKEEPQAVSISDLSDEQLMAEINTRREKVRELQKQTTDMEKSDNDWVFKKLYGMTEDEFDKKRWAYRAEERAAVDADKMGVYLELSKRTEAFMKPYENYIKSDEYKQEVERRKQEQANKSEEYKKLVDELEEMEEEKKLRDMEKMEAQKQAEKEKEKEISGKVSGKVSEEPPYAVSKIIGATGAYTEENVYHHDDIEPGLKDVVRDNYNWQVVASGESFVIQEDSEIFNVAFREETYRSSQKNYTVKSYDPQTGTGVAVNDKGKSYSFSISGKPGDMHIVIENR